MGGLVLAAFATLVVGAVPRVASAQELRARELSAPPEDLLAGNVRLGDSPILVSDHALFPVLARRGADGILRCTQSFEHGGDPGGAPLAVAVAMSGAGPQRGPWRITLRDPDGAVVYRSGAERAAGINERVGDLASLLQLAEPIDVVRLDLANARPGQWMIEMLGPADAPVASGVVIVSSPTANELRGQFESRVARIGVPRTFLLTGDARVAVADVTVTGPSGAAVAAVVSGPAASFVPVEAGRHTLTVMGRVEGRDGTWATRSIETTFDVSGSTLRFDVPAGDARGSGRVARRQLDPLRESLLVPVEGAASRETVVIAAEVWLVGEAAAEPVAWIANLAMVEGATGQSGHLSLTFDRRWLGRAATRVLNATRLVGREGTRLELRALRVQSRDGATLIDSLDALDAGAAPTAADFDPRDEASLLAGRAGGHAVGASVALAAASDAAPGSHALMLVHGYCSDGSPFPTNHFTGAVAQFSDPYAARSNDQFAQLIAGLGANYKSYGTVCHSQGGLASLHLYTFYWSGLDWATGPRLIQSVGSPYQGTPLAGNLAVLGSIFGVGCGPVTDMSPEGASAWLATIPTWARAKVWYWTTSYKDLPFSYDYCDFVSDLFLSNPDDGVIEKSKGQLPGATNMGHTEGWCHTTDMEDPPQCTDATRNAQMNAQAAR